jgi:hypothetical protein
MRNELEIMPTKEDGNDGCGRFGSACRDFAVVHYKNSSIGSTGSNTHGRDVDTHYEPPGQIDRPGI